ncbi:MAG TPA: hypothetical protein VNT80_01130 [Acidimicrobiales bacterium]|nr:hypothetical protein [Acidimicrobiales bacterium]
MNERPNVVFRLIRGFGQFWWDFLVGDTPELFVAALVIIGVIALLSERGHFNAAAIVVLPVLATLALAGSLVRAVRLSRRK